MWRFKWNLSDKRVEVWNGVVNMFCVMGLCRRVTLCVGELWYFLRTKVRPLPATKFKII